MDKLRELDYLTDYTVYACRDSKTKIGSKGPLTEKNCSYIYLGGFKEFHNPKIPLAFDKPGNHTDFMSVLFLDGSAKRYSTPAAGSCENIIIFLNNEYKYPPELFKKLLGKAKKIDNTLVKK